VLSKSQRDEFRINKFEKKQSKNLEKEKEENQAHVSMKKKEEAQDHTNCLKKNISLEK